MKFAIAPVTYWDSIGFDTTEWRKSLDGTKAICHLEYAEKLGANLHANPQVQIIDSVDPNLKNILESSEWVIDGTNGDLDSFSFLTKLNQFETKVNDAVSQKTADLTAQLQQTGKSLNAQLAQKIGSGKKAELEDLSPTVLSAIEGGEGASFNLLSIPQDYSVSPKKTTFFDIEMGINQLDKSTNVRGEFVNQTNGDISMATHHQRSQRMLIDKTKTNIIISSDLPYNTLRYAIFKSDGSFQTGAILDQSDYLIANNIYYIVIPIVEIMHDIIISHANIDNNKVMVEFTNESIPSSYVPYLYTETLKPSHLPILDGNYFANRSIGNDKLKADLPDFVKTKNLASHEYLKRGKFIHQDVGALYDNPGHDLFHRIPIDGGGHLTISGGFPATARTVFEDADYTYISGEYPAPETVVVPENARFFSYSSSGDVVDSLQIEVGTQATSFIEPGYVATNLVMPQVESDTDAIINLPKKIYALEGEELNVYFDNIVSGADKDYLFDVGTIKVGQQYEQFYRLTPDTSGDHNLSLTAYKDSKVVNKVDTLIKVSPKTAGNGVTRSVLILGDSTTNNGIAATKLNDNFSTDVMNIELMGSRGTGLIKHEGRSGWTARQFVSVPSTDNETVLNPFYNPTTQTFDFAYYKSKTGFRNPDYFIINLGINDTFGQITDSSLETKMNEVIDDFTTMINSIQSVSPDIKIGIAITIPPNYSQDGFAKAYGTGQTRWRYKRNNVLWCKKLIETYQDREAENIYLIPIHLNIDTRNNYGFQEEPINKRNTTVISRPNANGGVHPVESGYWQIADSYWFWLKSFES